MAEKEDRKSKRSQSTPETILNISRNKIEDVYLKAPYTLNAKKFPNNKI